jgi:hypothetical protein
MLVIIDFPSLCAVTLQDLNIRKPFRSDTNNDQQLMTMASRPQCLMEIYTNNCKPAPPLTKLNVYRYS